MKPRCSATTLTLMLALTLTALASLVYSTGARADDDVSLAAAPLADDTLIAEVRAATRQFRDVEAAEAAGYALFHGCVNNGPGHGAMGIHYVNGTLVGDGEIDAAHPEAIMYEFRQGRYELTAVEYVVIAEAWNANHSAPPVLGGQLFTYNGAPNRYGIPAFYALHVWAWKNNPDGAFSDFNPKVSCAEFVGDGGAHASH